MMMSANQKLTLPNLADNEQYKTAAAKLAELQTELAKVSTRQQAVLAELNDASQNPPRRIDKIEAKAYALLGVNSAGTSNANMASLREEYGTLIEKMQVLDAAVRIQKQTLDTLRGEASRAAIAQVLPTHRALVRDIVARLVELDAALVAECNLTDELWQRGIELGELRVMSLPGIGRLRDPNSRASAYLLECCEFGYLAVNELPKNLQEAGRAKTAKPLPAQAPQTANLDGWQT